MMRLVLLVAAASPAYYTEEEQRAAFEAFEVKFDKHYASEEEEAMRFAVFKENRIYIRKYNEENNGVTLGVTGFADLAANEFEQTYLQPKGLAQSEWGDLENLGTDLYSGAQLAASVDWTQRGAVTAVKAQGSCGGCWAFAAIGALEGAWAIATRQLQSMSEQELIDCADGDCVRGGLPSRAFSYTQSHGVCTEQSYSFQGRDGQCRGTSGCSIAIPSGRVTGYRSVTQNSEAALMEAVSRQPVAVLVNGQAGGPLQHYTGGVLRTPCSTNWDHAVLLVGYGESSGVKYWKIKNSWNTWWGEQGYGRLLRGIGGGGECGILMQPTYPVISGGPSPSPSPPSPSPPSPSPSPPSPSGSYRLGYADSNQCQPGDSKISSSTECSQAAQQLGMGYNGEQQRYDRPGGCWAGSAGYANFNPSQGSATQRRTPICRSRGFAGDLVI